MSNVEKCKRMIQDMNNGVMTPKEVQVESQILIDEQCPIPFGRPKYSGRKRGKQL